MLLSDFQNDTILKFNDQITVDCSFIFLNYIIGDKSLLLIVKS